MRSLLMVLALLVALPAAATDVRAFLDRDRVHLGDTVTLNISVQGAATASAPDFSVLIPDFVVSGTSRNQSIRIDNGTVTRTVLFGVVLKPRRTGTLTIPSFTVDGEHTRPLTLTVLPAGARASGTPGDPVFLRAEIEPASVYVGQQAHLSIRLYYAGTNLQGNLGTPDIDGADVRQMGKQKQYQSQQGGKLYRVVERDYAVIPDKAGELDIPPVQFSGNLTTGSGNYGGLLGYQSPVSAQSQSLQLEVRAKPARAGSGPWLPARDLSLSMQGLPADGKATVGTPITVTITESATGLGDASLPEPSLPALDGAEVYPDKSQGETDDDGQWLKAKHQRKFAIVPTRPGTLEIPAIAVDWWNVQDDKPATATIAAHTLQVSGSAVAGVTAPPPASAPGTTATAATSAAAPVPVAGANAKLSQATHQQDYWRWLAIALGALWLLTLLAFLIARRRRATANASKTEVTDAADAAAARRQFREATDPASQSRTLLAWAQAERPGVHNLGELAAQLDDEAQCQILRQLQQARYDERADAPDPGAVRKAFAKGFAWRKQDKPKPADEILPPLYPHR